MNAFNIFNQFTEITLQFKILRDSF